MGDEKLNKASYVRVLKRVKELGLTVYPFEITDKSKDLIKSLRITDIKDGRYLQLKLKQLTRQRNLLVSVKSGKTYYKKHKK